MWGRKKEVNFKVWEFSINFYDFFFLLFRKNFSNIFHITRININKKKFFNKSSNNDWKMCTHNEFLLLKALLFVIIIVIVVAFTPGNAKRFHWRVVHLQKLADEGNFQLLHEHHVKVTANDEIAKECLITRKEILCAKLAGCH